MRWPQGRPHDQGLVRVGGGTMVKTCTIQMTTPIIMEHIYSKYVSKFCSKHTTTHKTSQKVFENIVYLTLRCSQRT